VNSSGKLYTLHSRLVTNPTGEIGKFYYFADAEGEGALDELPQGYEIAEQVDGLPVLHHAQHKKLSILGLFL
jgi:hypothetical protein